MSLEIKHVDNDFKQWPLLLKLLKSAFAFQIDRINPPSSLTKLNVQTLAQKAYDETLLLAWKDGNLAGCIFAKNIENNALYVGKHAVLPTYQGQGIGSALMNAIEVHAKSNAISYLELQVRIELVENQATFAALGFIETKRTSHPGFDSITSVTMQKML